MAAQDPAAERPSGDAQRERERADRAGRPLAQPAVPVEQGDDPVAHRHAQSEGGPVEPGKAVKARIAENARPEPLRARGPRAYLVRRCDAQQRHPHERDDDSARKGSPPADPALHLRHDGERETATRKPDAPVQALSGRRAADRAHVGAAGDEAQACADAGEGAHHDREPGDGRGHRRGGEHGDQGEPEQPGAARTEAIARPPARDLHDQVGEEERGREEADCRQPYAVAMCELLGYRTGVGDVPAGGKAEGAATEDRAPQPRAYAIRPPASRISRSRAVSGSSSRTGPSSSVVPASTAARMPGTRHSSPCSTRS